MNKNLPFLIVFALSLFWTVSLFIAPLTLAPDTVSDLNGRANVVDFPDLWDSLPPYHRAIYYFGDFNCHQKWYRSFTINDNQMPVDARMTSIFVFANLGFVTMMFVEADMSISVAMLNVLPKRMRGPIERRLKPELFAIILVILTALPVAIDGFYQLLTSYESTNLKRVVTGIPFGWMGGVIVGAMIISVMEFRKFHVKKETIEPYL
jgi:uncharacterized membrane protein